MTYPSVAEERRIAAAGDELLRRVGSLELLFDGHELNRMRDLIGRIPVSDHVVDFAVGLVRATRPSEPTCPETVRPLIEWGAGPRAGQALLLAARCFAALTGDPTPTIKHVAKLAPAALRGRVVLSHAAYAQRVTTDQVIATVLNAAKRPA